MIKIQNINKKIGNFELKNIDFTVEKGEYFVILGPSGTGKTMLLEIIAGLQKINSGALYFNEKLMNKVDPEYRRVGMVYQDYMLFPHMSVRENILFGAKLKAIENKYEKLERLLEDLSIKDLENRSIKNLSGGERQRVALARTLMTEPEILLLDEPLSALDSHTKTKVQEQLKKIHKNYQMTTLHVTHDFNEAIHLADRIAIIDNGEILQIGKPDQVFQKPKNAFVASFLGSKNLFNGKVIQENTILTNKGLKISALVKPNHEVNFMISSDNIILSLDRIESSAKNSFKGRVTKINKKVSMVEVTVDIGVNLVVYVTYSSFNKMAIENNKEVFVTFKATAVHIF